MQDQKQSFGPGKGVPGQSAGQIKFVATFYLKFPYRKYIMCLWKNLNTCWQTLSMNLTVPVQKKRKKYSAYIAAMVEELCFTNNLDIPEWVFDKKYQLKEPFFVGGLESLKAFLIVENPLPFRRRNIFVSENVLKRA